MTTMTTLISYTLSPIFRKIVFLWILPSIFSCALVKADKGELNKVNLVYPGKTWDFTKPADAGMDSSKLEILRKFTGGRGCIVRHGYMVYTWGDQSKRADVASAGKPWYSHFLFKALEDGKISNLDEKVKKWEPRLNKINKNLGFKDRNITWRHFANQISCYGVAEPPGTAYDYNDFQMALFWDTLFLKVYDATYETVDARILHPLLTDILKCEDNPTFIAFGVKDRPGRVGVSVRDFARFGLLYLRQGSWKDMQLISRKHAKIAVTSSLPNAFPRTAGKEAEMISGQRTHGSGRIPDNQTDHYGSYSWLWWTNGIDRNGKRHWHDAPLDTYGAFGHFGPRALVVIPSLDIIISWNDTRIKGREMENKALKLLVEAVISSPKNPKNSLSKKKSASNRAQTGQIVVDPDHPQWLKRKDGGPFFMAGPGDPEDFLFRGKLNNDGTRSGDQMALINKLKGTGANCIYLMAVRSHGGDGDRTHNPFVDNDPSKGINMNTLEQWESWFTEMDRNDIVIFFFFYDDSTLIWNTGDKVEDREKYFIRTLVNRFEHHRNLIWCVAEEYQEKLSAARVKSIAAEIRAADDYDHVIAVHKLNGLDFSEFADDPNIDQFAVQYNESSPNSLHLGVITAWKRAAGRYNLNMSEAASYGTGVDARKKSWACAMGGAYVMILRMDIAGTPVSDLLDCGRLVRFFQSTNFNEMFPHDELKFGGTEYVLAKPGDSYIAYASNIKGNMGLKNMSKGTYTFNWFDCVNGKRITQADVKVADGDRIWSKPSSIGNEVAVHIMRTGK